WRRNRGLTPPARHHPQHSRFHVLHFLCPAVSRSLPGKVGPAVAFRPGSAIITRGSAGPGPSAFHLRGVDNVTRHLGTLLLASFVVAGSLASPTRADDATKKLRVLLIDGQNNHDWRSTSPWLKQVLEESGRFRVDVSSNLKPG